MHTFETGGGGGTMGIMQASHITQPRFEPLKPPLKKIRL